MNKRSPRQIISLIPYLTQLALTYIFINFGFGRSGLNVTINQKMHCVYVNEEMTKNGFSTQTRHLHPSFRLGWVSQQQLEKPKPPKTIQPKKPQIPIN
jgi:hypothetical protein